MMNGPKMNPLKTLVASLTITVIWIFPKLKKFKVVLRLTCFPIGIVTIPLLMTFRDFRKPPCTLILHSTFVASSESIFFTGTIIPVRPLIGFSISIIGISSLFMMLTLIFRSPFPI